MIALWQPLCWVWVKVTAVVAQRGMGWGWSWVVLMCQKEASHSDQTDPCSCLGVSTCACRRHNEANMITA